MCDRNGRCRKSRRFSSTRWCRRILAATLVTGWCGPLDAQEMFRRGDVNSDGTVSLADAHFLTNFLFRGREAPPCLLAGDADDNGSVDLADGVYVYNFSVERGPPPPAPFEEIGEDPTELPAGRFELDCASYGVRGPLDDPQAQLVILDVSAPGGSSGDMTITIGAASGVDIAGYQGVISVQGGIFSEGSSGTLEECGPGGCNAHRMTDLTKSFDRGVGGFRVIDGQIHFGALTSLVRDSRILASASTVPVLELHVCLEVGTTAGEYELELSRAELVDEASARSIPASGSSFIATVGSDLDAGVGCDGPPVPPEPPAELIGEFVLGSTPATAGGSVTVPYSMSANGDIQGFSFSIDFDETVLQARAVRKIYQKPDGSAFGFERFEFDNNDATEGNGGIDEGFVLGAVVFGFTTPEYNLPANEEHDVLSIEFDVRSDAESGTDTQVRFLEGAVGTGEAMQNTIVAFGTGWTPHTANSFVFVDSLIEIVDEISVFIRGDSNGDGTVDLSDAQRTLSFLFLGRGVPACFDAADADDDGDINVSDPIRTLDMLFLGGDPLPPPSAVEPGSDPTPDALGCLLRGD